MRLKSPWTPRLDVRPGPPAERLVAAMSADILEGRLEAGDRLPAHRDLADRLCIGLGTVTKAYGVLERRGLVRSVKGRGTFVALTEARQGPQIELSRNVPPAVMSDRVLARTFVAMAKRLDAGLLNGYPPPGGHAEHRRLMAGWFAGLGMDTDPAQLVLTTGAHHAVLLALSATCAGGTLFTECQTYPGIQPLARYTQTHLVGVAMDSEGLVPDALDRLLYESRPSNAALYVTPTRQNPTTATMGKQRRSDIVAVCRAHDLGIIEDDVYTMAADPALPPLAMLAPERTFYVNSMSKMLNPSLRIGGLVSPASAMDGVFRTAEATSTMVSPVCAAVMEQWVIDGTAKALLRAIEDESIKRYRLAEAALGPSMQRTTLPGYHVWLPMEEPAAHRLERAAAKRGVVITPPEATSVGPSGQGGGLRLCLGAPAISDLKLALEVLASL